MARAECTWCMNNKVFLTRKFKQSRKGTETFEQFIYRCRMSGAILRRRCSHCGRLYNSWLGMKAEKMYRDKGIRQCCRTCKYLRPSHWDGDERAGALDREWAFERLCQLMRQGHTKAEAYNLTFDQNIWYYPDGLLRHVGEQTGEYPGIPICELDVIDFDDFFGGLAWTGTMSQKDGRIGRQMAEEWARITDPGQHATRIRFSPNAPMVRGETAEVEHPELGWHDEQFPTRAVPAPAPNMVNYQSAGGRSGLARVQVSINQRRFIENFLWEYGCNLGVHRSTGRQFTIWDVPNGQAAEEVSSQEEVAQQIASDIARGDGMLSGDTFAGVDFWS